MNIKTKYNPNEIVLFNDIEYDIVAIEPLVTKASVIMIDYRIKNRTDGTIEKRNELFIHPLG